MSKIAEMRQKRGDLWDKAKAFLNEHADANGMMSAEDTATYERMEKEIDNFGIAIDRQERAERLEREMNAPTSDILSSRPEKPVPDKQGRASDEYRDAFWKMVRDRSAHYTVFNALQIGTDSEGGYLCPDEYERTLVQALEDENKLRSLCKVIRTSSGDRKIPLVASHGTASWVDEEGAIPESDDAFGQITLGARTRLLPSSRSLMSCCRTAYSMWRAISPPSSLVVWAMPRRLPSLTATVPVSPMACCMTPTARLSA